MYLTKLLVLNSGPNTDLEIETSFDVNGHPRPLILVGKNGSGKTNILSILADALVEIAAREFSDVAPQVGIGHKYLRLLGPVTTRLGSNFEVAVASFLHEGKGIFYVSKSGTIEPQIVVERFPGFPQDFRWDRDPSHKEILGNTSNIEQSFRRGCYVFFPSNRFETPHWSSSSPSNEEVTFDSRLSRLLGKPIVLTSTLSDLKPWMIDVLLDQSVDAFTLTIGGNELEKIIAETKAHSTGLANINGILRILFGEQEIRLVRMGRNYRNRKLQIARENTVFLPSLDSLSTGQSTLLSIFGTILRYADTGVMSCPTTQMTGLVLIDEVDAHLHSELQLEALPNLMTLFPNVQFIISCHSPFVALGMERAYGEENLQIIELPDGKRIRAERFGELIQYFEALRQTDIFEDEVSEKVRELKRPVVICEGQTDSKYFETAANLLGYDKLSREVDFDWVGTVSDGRAVDGGKDRLKQAVKLLQNNPKLCRTPVVVLFDCDTDEDLFDSNALHVRVLQRNEQNEKCDTGVENLLPDSAFEERFFVVKEIKRGANRTTIRELNKSALCDYLCKEKREPEDFERFGETLGKV